MKRLLQQFGRALVVYAGAAYVGDRLVRPHWELRKAQAAAKKLGKPLLVIGHGLTRPLGDVTVDIAEEDALPVPVPDGSIGCVLILHALEYADDPLAIAVESERVLADEGEVMVASSHPAMVHSWLGRKWVLFNLDDGRKHAKALWGAKKPSAPEALESDSAPSEESAEAETQDTNDEGV